MKAKNLLLAGLAAFAIASCSNNEDVLNGVDSSAVNNAKMRLTIALPQANGTRATGDKELGLPVESKINDLTIIVKIGANTIYQTYAASELTNNTTPYFEVAAGEATVLAYVNYGKGVITLDNYEGNKESVTYKGLTIDGPTASIADKGNFHMYGEGTKTVDAGTKNTAEVYINRVVAKIVEKSYTKAFENVNVEGKPTITLTNYSIVNLNKEVSTKQDDATNLERKLYNFYESLENTICYDFFAQMKSSELNGNDQISYCLANQSPDTPAGEINRQTYLVYKAKVKYADIPEGTTFYVRKDENGVEKAYTLDGLKNAYPNIYNDMTESNTIEEWLKVSVKKYENGYSYYKKPIQTTKENGTKNEVLRNNVYKVTVTGITGIGAPALDIPPVGDLTQLNVEIVVKGWTIQNNDITLQ